MPGPTFDQCFVAKDQDTLIEHSLTLIKQPCLFLFETTQLITQKIAWNTSLEPFLPGGHDHDTVCWPTLSTINDTAERRVLLVLCLCVYVQVHLCVCLGRGCMFAIFVCLSYWATVWSNLQVKNWSQVLYMQKEQQNMIQTFKLHGGIYFKFLCHLVTPICTTIGSGAGQYVKVPIWITVEVLSSIFFYSVTMQYWR